MQYFLAELSQFNSAGFMITRMGKSFPCLNRLVSLTELFRHVKLAMKVEDTHGSEIDMRDMKSNGRVEEEEQLPEFFTYKDIGSEYFQVLVHVSISTIVASSPPHMYSRSF